MGNRFGIWMLMALGLAVIAAGCGGSSAPPLSKGEFLKQGNAMCRSAEEQRGKVITAAIKAVPKGGKLSTAQQEKLVVAALVPYEKLSEELGNLSAPKGDEEKVEKIVSALEASVEKAKAEPKTALDGSAFQQMDKLVVAYGLSSCSV